MIANVITNNTESHGELEESAAEVEEPAEASKECECSPRGATPEPPELPQPIESYSVEELKKRLLDHYKSSTFNTCKHQQLPLMQGPPLEFHVDENATSYVCHTPAAVPAHWEEKVKSDLDRDVDLGVLEKVPPNTPVTWCHRMVLTRKHNGDPRRTVNLQPLNNACKWQMANTPYTTTSTTSHDYSSQYS